MTENMPYSYCIYGDSTADYPERFLSEPQFRIMNMSYYMNQVLYDGEATPFMPIDDFYAEMKAGACPQTSLITPQYAKEKFSEALEKGLDVFYLCFSSALSGTYKAACAAAEELKSVYPDRRVLVYDSLSATMGEGLFLHLLVLKRRAGATIDELWAYADEIRDHVVQIFMVDDLYHLARGGRISKSAAIAGTAINLKPVLVIAQDGTLKCTNSMMGNRLALKMILSKMEQKIAGYHNDIIFIGYATEKASAEWLEEKVRKQFPDIGEIVVDRIGAIIGSHTGSGMVAIFFLGSDKN